MDVRATSLPRIFWQITSRNRVRPCAISALRFLRGADGPVFIVIQNGREWIRFCESVLERPEMAADPRFCTNANRVENLEELKKLINESFHTNPREALIAKLQAAEIACGNINNIADLSKHPL